MVIAGESARSATTPFSLHSMHNRFNNDVTANITEMQYLQSLATYFYLYHSTMIPSHEDLCD